MKIIIGAALAAALAFSPAFAGGDVTNDSGVHIGTGQDCDGDQCDVVNDSGEHIGTAEDCQFNDTCDVTNDSGHRIGSLDNDDDE
jgi:hypothetical protein